MKILLLLICFISTSVFAGERKDHGAGVKDEWHKDKMVGKKKNSAGVQDITFDTFKKAPGMHQGAVKKEGSKKRKGTNVTYREDSANRLLTPTDNSDPGTKTPSVAVCFRDAAGNVAKNCNKVANSKNSTESQITLDTQAPTGIKQKQKRITGNKESSMHQGAMNSVRPKKPGSKKPACSLHDSVHC